MSETELIAKQALKIAELEEKTARYKEDMYSIHYILHNIGAPLNDNVRMYTKGQLIPFFQIDKIIEEYI